MHTIRPMIQQLFSTASEPLLIVNTNREVEYFNKDAQELLNISENERRKLEMDESSKSTWTSFLNKIREQQCGTCVLNVKLSDYKYKKMKLEGYFVKKNKLIFLRVVNILSTSYREIKEKYSSFLLDELSHGVVITNLEGIVLDVNQKALQFLQCDYNEIINTSHKNIFDKLDDFEFNKLKFYHELKNKGQATLVLRKIDNGEKEQYFKIESKMNSRKNMIVSTITDVTDQFELKNQIMNQDYMKEIRKVTAAIAHEIRNPMTSLKGYIDLLKNVHAISGDHKRYLSVMESELNRIDNFLNEILTTTKHPQENVEKVNLTKVATEVIELMQPYALKENILIEMQNDETVGHIAIKGNENRIKQMLINLIKNAIEVMEKGGYITLAVTKLNDQAVQLSVKDEGTGISAENLKDLFKPFYTTKPTGTGLGLPIVKEIVEEHHGSIRVESKLNCGTTFYIEFPICNETNPYVEHDEKLIEMWYKKSVNSLPIT